jgi:hypothetical protein
LLSKNFRKVERISEAFMARGAVLKERREF